MRWGKGEDGRNYTILAAKSELEHLETYQPKQLMVQGDFMYRGAGVARLGELESIAGEIVEVESEEGVEAD
jgi:hypothetical protein